MKRMVGRRIGMCLISAPYMLVSLLVGVHSERAVAQQVEIVAQCDEDGVPPISEPIDIQYGSGTTGCEISPAAESDVFRFIGTEGEIVKATVVGFTNNFDAGLEIRDGTNAVIASTSCVAGSISVCSATVSTEILATGTHTITITDQGADNVGEFGLQLENVYPGPEEVRLDYDSRIVVDGRVTLFVDASIAQDELAPPPDHDQYYFYGQSETTIRFVVAGLTNNLDSEIEIRSPSGVLLLDGSSSGAGCVAGSISTCSFSVDLDVDETGIYTVLVADDGYTNPGDYELALFCVIGNCDTDGDAVADVRRRNLRYGEAVEGGELEDRSDGDQFRFMGTPPDTVQFTVDGLTNNLDPAIQVFDPNGSLVINGPSNSASCVSGSISTCSFSVNFAPTVAGEHTVIVYDQGFNDSGTYDFSLECTFSPDDFVCENLPGSFNADVPEDYWAFSFIELLADAGITAGCGPDSYCPEDPVTRGQMAVFLERGINGGNFSPPECSGTLFEDVGAENFACDYIEQLYFDGITSGCGPGVYCPQNAVTRAQMAVFLLRALYGVGFSPPAPSGVFADVDTGYWAAAWIEQLAAEGITSGCGGGNYCPDQPVTRAQMAVFLVRTFGLDY